MIDVIEDITQGGTSREDAIIRLLSLDLPMKENKFKNAIVELLRKLPRQCITDDTNESELITRYIDPFLCGLFDDPDQGTLLQWTNDTKLQAKYTSEDS